MDQFLVILSIGDLAAGGDKFYRFENPVVWREPQERTELARLLEQDLDYAAKNGLWWAGALGYGAAIAFEPELLQQSTPSLNSVQAVDQALAAWGLFKQPKLVDLADLQCQAAQDATFELPFLASWSYDDYHLAFEACKHALQTGQSYQLNLTMSLQGSILPEIDHLHLWQRLLTTSHVAHACFVRHSGGSIVSLSPELFFSKSGHQLLCRPMKGTATRQDDALLDQEARSALQASPKNRAENLMIVDMIRNDLGKIATIGSVQVSKQFEIESYPSVYQMTSTIEATYDGLMYTLLAALFPCASITGAPKIKTMQVLSTIEGRDRAWYTGSAGWVSPSNDANFNVLIRSLSVSHDGQVSLGVGGGIVWDSSLLDEYNEALAKARFCRSLEPSFDLVETLRYDPGHGFWWPQEHLSRMAASAQAFDRAFSVHEASKILEREIDAYCANHSTGPLRIRLALSRDGSFSTQVSALTKQPIAQERQQASSVELALSLATSAFPQSAALKLFLAHKTSLRSHYLERENQSAGLGTEAKLTTDIYNQTLFYAHDGRLTESSYANLVLELKGRFFTPHHSAGLLPGIMRNHLLQAGLVSEADLYLDDLQEATSVWLINSVRGWMRTKLT